jgi:nucleoside-diphosphate-sugar epimerase
MKVLVTGASGFLGSHVAQQLVEAGHPVRALVRKTSDTRLLRTLPILELFEGAVEDRGSCFEACRGMDAVVHGAALVKARSAAEFHLANVVGTQNMVDAAAAAADTVRRFVLVSSLAARAPSPDGRPLPPDAPPRPVTTYGRSKLGAERIALAAKDRVHVVAVRPTGVYGPRDREMLQLFQYARARVLPFIGDPDGNLTLIHGEDCARAIVLALGADVPSGRAYDLDDGRTYTRRELAEGLERAVGKKALLRFPIPAVVARAFGAAGGLYGRVANKAVMVTREKVDELLAQWVGDSSAARAELGFEARFAWPEGACQTADWYLANGWL